MNTDLSQNPEHLRVLCARLDLGFQTQALARVTGGFHHKMWRLETECGTYAVKQLSPDSNFSTLQLTAHYNITECVAEEFSSRGVPSIFALRYGAEYLQLIGETAYLVYPWTNAKAEAVDDITDEHALAVARLLAKMHKADITVPGLRSVLSEAHPEDKVALLVEKALAMEVSHAEQMKEQLPSFLDIVGRYESAIAILGKHVVVCHGDLDHKNVLWSEDNTPILIDWESARRLNPTYEVLLEALDWCGITSSFDHELLKKFVAAYVDAGGEIDEYSLQASLDCILSDWLTWLMYNVGRCLDVEDAEQRAVGAAQVELSLTTIVRLGHLLPWLMDR